jgi:diguanylate cyclase (GGDEF)-like protein
MFDVISCIATEHDIRLVLMAAFICLLGTVAGFLLLERSTRNSSARTAWTVAAATATGVTIWATHFVAMLAYDGGMPIGFDVGLTGLSAVAGLVLSGAGFFIGTSTGGILRAPIGGAAVGLGIASMHFIGMAAVRVPASQRYAPGEVAFALVGGVILAAVAFDLFGRATTRLRVVAPALMLTLSICTVHFVAMSALTLVPEPGVAFKAVSVERDWLAYSVAAVAISLLLLSVGAAVAHWRLDFHLTESRRFRSLADASSEGIIIAREGQILEINARMADFLKEGDISVAGLSLPDLIPALDLGSAASPRCAVEAELVLGSSAPIPVEVLHRSIRHQGAPAEVIVIRDLRERREANARIQYLAHHDALTGLPNRVLLNDRLSQALVHARSAREKVAVLCLDLDRFKTVNDVYGHGVGDEVLRKVAATLTSATRGVDTVARLGGDEFVIVQTEAAQPDGARSLAARLVEAFGGDFGADSAVPSIGVSVGIALFPDDGADAETLLSNADTALYRAKNAGRGTSRFFEASMDEALRDRRLLEQQLRLALIEKQLYLDYQPLADARTGAVIGFEALLRWKHPVRGQVPPSLFVPIAEESGYMAELGLWVLREATREAARWEKPLHIAVNLSPVQFYQSDLAEKIQEVLKEVGLDPKRLELEITESTLLGDREAVLKVLNKLKSIGVRFAMDDFGTGYSSLTNLQCFPFDKIKIDRSFVSTLESDPESIEIVRAIVGLGKGFKMPVVAEGVETERQHEILREEKCTELQGYLFGIPQPIEAFENFTRDPIPVAA